MDDHLLTVPACQQADRLHECMTIALAIAGAAFVDVPGIQAVRAMIAVATTADRCANELLAAPALERLIGLGTW